MKDIHKLQKFSSNPIIGIYFLWDCDKLVYIGQSTDIYKRIYEHRNVKKFTKFSFIECLEYELNDFEKKYIQTYNPILNKTFSKQSISETLRDIQLEIGDFKIISSTAVFNLTGIIVQIPLVVSRNKGLQFVGFKGSLKPNAFTPNTYYGELLYEGCNYFIVFDINVNKYVIKPIQSTN